jgi:hypothetical protein
MYEGMQAAASRPGWKLEPANPGVMHLYAAVALLGSEAGVPVRVERVGGAQSLTTMAFLDPPLPFHFAITHEGFVDTIKSLVGFHDIEIGDAAFDKSFRVVSKDVDAVKRLLVPEVRDALTKLSAAVHPFGMRGFHVSEHGVSVTRVTGAGAVSTEEALGDVPVTVAVVQALRRAG